MAQLAKIGEVWVLYSDFAERAIPKAAGFWWHGGDCRDNCGACKAGLPLKVWWSPKMVAAAKVRQYADQWTRSELEPVGQAREASLVQSRATDAPVDVPAPAGLTYMSFQKAGIAYASGRQSTIIGDEMGLGKTIQALGTVNADPSVTSVLVVCPATLRLNWRRESERWLVRPFLIHVIEGREMPAAQPEDGRGLLVIVNYDKLVGKEGAALRTALLAREWGMLVADEAHYMKNPDAQRTQAILGRPARPKKKEEKVLGVIERARRRLFLTGTPVLNKPVELWPLLHAVAPEEFPSFWVFAKRYCGACDNGYGMTMGGATNLDELQEKMRATCMVRRLKRDVLTELPAKIRQVVELPRNGADGACDEADAAWEAQEERMDEAAAEVELARASGNKERYESAVKRLRDAGRVAFEEIARALHDLGVAKAPKVAEHVESMIEAGIGKVLVFAHHHDVLDAIAGQFGDRAVMIDGRTKMDERQALVDRFQSDPTVNVFVGSITAAGVGITLTAASNVVFAELDWVPANISQAEDRCHRIGQAETVLVQHLVFDGSLDARMAKRLVAKQRIADDALDTKHPDRMAAALEEASLPVIPRKRADLEPAQEMPVDEAMRSAASLAMRAVAGVCDGARKRDDMGFNKFDSQIGNALACEPRLSDRQVLLARRLAQKYQRQLGDEVLAALQIERKKK